jgi:hypothetical protein
VKNASSVALRKRRAKLLRDLPPLARVLWENENQGAGYGVPDALMCVTGSVWG